MHICSLYISLSRYLIKSSAVFKNQVVFLLLNFKSSLYIFLTVLYQICVLQMFSPSLWFVFSFSWRYLSQSRTFYFLILMKSCLSIINFRDQACGVISKKSSPCPRPSGCSPVLSCRSFIHLHFIFRSVIHCELFFVKSLWSECKFIFLYVNVQFHHQLLKRLCKLHCKRSVDSLSESISGFSVLFHWSVCLFFSSAPHSLD